MKVMMAQGGDETMSFKSGRHFLQIPGPTNIPFSKGGLDAAMAYLAHPDNPTGNAKAAE